MEIAMVEPAVHQVRTGSIPHVTGTPIFHADVPAGTQLHDEAGNVFL